MQSKTKATSSIIASGAKATTLAFIVSGSACQASWGGYYGLNASDEWFDAKQVISDTRAAGSEPIISFGGAAGRELARTCTSVDALADSLRAQDVLAAMELNDALGSRTMIRFEDLQRNPKLAPQLFRFTPPKGADVLEDK